MQKIKMILIFLMILFCNRIFSQEKKSEAGDGNIIVSKSFSLKSDSLKTCMEISFKLIPSTFEIVIYNRWGAKIFESTNINDCWNGKDEKGEYVQEGSYYWIIKCSYNNTNESYSSTGFVTIIK